MGELSISLCLVYCFYLCMNVAVYGGGGDSYGRYDTGARVVDGKLNVHLVPHSHLDVGWLKTVDQYYVGTMGQIQDACVENVLDSVVNALRHDPNRKFVFAEMAFFHRWWVTQSLELQGLVRKLVHNGQLEFVNGGWCMHDEATTHYIDMIDQTTLGHRMIKQEFGTTPRAGWQVDPFGHSAVQAYLLGTELGFESVHFGRIDHQDREKRKANKSMEVVWRGSKTFGSSSQIFANVFPVSYYPPASQSFLFEVRGNYVPIQDNPLLFDYDVESHVKKFIELANEQAESRRTDHIMWTMGGDFQYQYAESWFKQMDKLIHHVNQIQGGKVNALYSTPSIYTDAKYAADIEWPLKTGDFFPYADEGYWTAFFSSRPAFKRYVRMLSGYYLATRQLEFLVGRRSAGPNTYSLGDALGIAQHHDAITGTAKQHVSDDYTKRLALGASHAEVVSSSALSCLVSNTRRGEECHELELKFSQCGLLNISHCPPTEKDIDQGKSLVVVVYNPLGWPRNDIIRIPVNDDNLFVHDSLSKVVDAQFLEFDDVTRNLKKFYLMANLGLESEEDHPKYWLLFRVSVQPLGWSTYFISRNAGKEIERKGHQSTLYTSSDSTIEVGPGNLKMNFSRKTGLSNWMYNSRTGVYVRLEQKYLWYNSGGSGAYVFKTGGSDPPTVLNKARLTKVIVGPLVDEVHQRFNSWIYQVTRIYKDKDYAEVEYTIGPLPTGDDGGKEVVTRMETNMATGKVFYTDSNGRDFLERVRDHRADWTLDVEDRIAGNYYPVNLGIFIKDNDREFSVLVDRASGGSSIRDGEIEVKLHRRTSEDDGKGVGEALKEDVCAGPAGRHKCEGLTVRGNYYMSINKLGEGAFWRRTVGQEIYSPLLLAFTHANFEEWRGSHTTKATTMGLDYALPLNIALITLEELVDGKVLLRLAHLYEADEDSEHSTLATVELSRMFSGKKIIELEETNLSTNQPKLRSSQRKEKEWKVEGDNEDHFAPLRGGRVTRVDGNYIVELGPMEIRTFLLKFKFD